ncbi:MAG TPA: hydroxysqualene dehydroxylase HpnE [Ignavibacteriaceae bacterium]|nr:hydroxysqualene dehydroxylase HpnE [Ignavibacteriaceae bacterium]
MKKVLVIGGGFAGLSAASFLAANNFQVELIEASPKLGGRAYSFSDSKTRTVIDNGQHILMGCYSYTIDFLNLIGAFQNIIFQKNLKVNFVNQNFQIHQLSADRFFYPFNLLSSILKFKALKYSERISIVKFFLKIFFQQGSELLHLSVSDLLDKENQNENTRKAFWNILILGSLNCGPGKASAKIFTDILKEIFFKGNLSSTIILPKYGLSETFCEPAKKFIEQNGGSISLSESVQELNIENDKVVRLLTNKRTISDFDFVISSIPLFALEKLNIAALKIPKYSFEYSTILTVHLWLKENNLADEFYGLIDSPVHWVFNKSTHLTLVISDADYLNEKSKEEILELATTELQKYLLIPKEKIIHYKILKEKRATFIPSNSIINKRPSTKTNIKNLFLAGDWIDTGLPSTIESAVKSGWIAFTEIEHQVVGK